MLGARGRIAKAEVSLAGLPGRLLTHIGRERLQIVSLMRHADSSMRNAMGRRLAAVGAQDRVLQSLSYKNVLKRGYAVVRDENDQPLTRAEAIAAGAAITLEFTDGRVAAVAGEGGDMPGTPPAAAPPAAKKKAAKSSSAQKPDQGSLF